MTTIYYTQFSQPSEEDQFNMLLEKSIPESIRNKILSFKAWEDRLGSLFGKLLLKEVLHSFGYTSFDLNTLNYSKYSRPYADLSIDFNISHTRHTAAIIVSDNARVGIDLEENLNIPLEDFKSVFDQEEWRDIKQSNNPINRFYYYWTRKEAISKADGRGLGLTLAQLNVMQNIVELENVLWYLSELHMVPQHTLHVATDKFISPADFIVRKVSFFNPDQKLKMNL